MYNMLRKRIYFICLTMLIISCSSKKKEKKEVALYNTHCASCHIAPAIEDLPRNIWEDEILPEMGARLGIRENGYSPYAGLPFGEQSAIIESGIYPSKPLMPLEDWALLKKYILSLAPDTLQNDGIKLSEELTQFTPNPISLDQTKGTLFTFMEYNEAKYKLVIGDLSGGIAAYDFSSKEIVPMGGFGNGITSIIEKEGTNFITTIGILNQSDMVNGRIFSAHNGSIKPVINDVFHRPVHTLIHDLDKNGTEEIVVSEFGNLTGQLSILVKNEQGQYQKRILLNKPGSLRVIHRDMDKDGKEDLIVLSGQGDEGITIFYQENDLAFRAEKVISYSPVYGSSWFDLVDYDNDGDDDIIIVNGDNADKSYVHKPYHGMRIHINNGKNEFSEEYFYPLNGATRVVSNDFDKDGDLDFGLLSTFPDYENHPELSFVYLENTDSKSYSFKAFTFTDSNLGKWFLMDTGDIDNDGDEDIILSSFTYPFTPAPTDLAKFWIKKNVDIMVLKNNLEQ
ncbi:MAG: hypothetical protein COA50_05660 [Flavobacteriaceae bacterium]|nr:MAG: hypothetical protein COA50_05660 [Flavobacteriaceae bacterium]